MKIETLEKYARLVIKTGVNLQQDQLLVISAPLECAAFSRALAERAYQEGARDVVVVWNDEQLARIRFLRAPEAVFAEYPDWQRDMYNFYVRQGAVFVSIAASDPEVMKGVEPGRLSTAQKTRGQALKEYRERLMRNENGWCVVSVPTPSWAMKVFTDVPEAEAMDRLEKAIAAAVRLDAEDPVTAWEEHKQNLRRNMNWLNEQHFRQLQYKNSLGTDVTVDLPEKHWWSGGAEHIRDGVEFVANMPTEEIFSMPQREGVNGKVVSALPLPYNGNLIENFSLTFRAGKVVDFTAEKGYDILKGLLDTDEGSRYLGEVALVPWDSPINRQNILFYNTLFDENASCHFALGKAYPSCLRGGSDMGPEELAAAGANDSLTHVDFMIGTADLEITGITDDGRAVPVFRQGNFTQER
ncbi:MAG TPA: aminopeptidase [Patescibacteria group bacterium]|nr:aminopeptidase [Patescibacteria group bacterium]